jgi:hypothetical protein
MKAGIIDDYKSFVQQREARWWTIKDQEIPSFKERKTFGYRMTDYANNGHIFEASIKRLMVVDMQTDCFKVLVRDFCEGGASRLIYQGTVRDWSDIAWLQAQYRIQDYHVAVDAGNWSQAVYKECAERKWVALIGSGGKSWVHTDKATKKATNRPYSPARQGRVASAPRKQQGGRPAKMQAAWFYEWSNLFFKDWLSRLASGQAVTWEYADDVEDEYIQSLDSEVRKVGPDGKPKWEKVGSRPNHFWDCECMSLVLASIIGGVFVDAPETNQAD